MASIDLLRVIREADARLLAIVGDLELVTVWYSDGEDLNDPKDWHWKTHEVEFDAESTIGEYLGKGIGGMVFRLEDEEGEPINKVLKIVKLLPVDESFMEYAQHQPLGVQKTAWGPLIGSKVLAMNQFQAMLYEDLADAEQQPEKYTGPKIPSAIPKVYSCAIGLMNEAFRDKVYEAQTHHPMDSHTFKIFNDNFPVGTHIGYWVMEYVPCTSESHPPFCGFAPSAEQRPTSAAELAKDPRFRKEQKGYQDVSKFLHRMGWVVKDTINPGNFGYRKNGQVVFFDLFVIPWPPTRVEGELKQMAHSLLSRQDIIDFRNTIRSGHYFNRRTQASAYSAENRR